MLCCMRLYLLCFFPIFFPNFPFPPMRSISSCEMIKPFLVDLPIELILRPLSLFVFLVFVPVPSRSLTKVEPFEETKSRTCPFFTFDKTIPAFLASSSYLDIRLSLFRIIPFLMDMGIFSNVLGRPPVAEFVDASCLILESIALLRAFPVGSSKSMV